MDFIDQIKALSSNLSSQLDRIKTEEATKTSLIMPFIQALGYNVFDINEVVPEFDANVGASRKYKLDYAIIQDGKPIILIECKHHADKLANDDAHSQLFHYFAATKARIGVLTNGLMYRFYSDLVEPNKLDEKPFLEIDMLNLQDGAIAELKRLSKQSFDIEEILTTASELKYTREIQRILTDELNAPSDEFIRFFAAQVYPGRITERVKEEFEGFVKRAFRQFIREQISGLLQSASSLAESGSTEPEQAAESPSEDEDQSSNGVVTTEEELEGWYIVKSILRESIEASRVAMRDVMTYCGILLDDNNRKPICRFYFNNPERLRLGLFDHGVEGKNEEKVDLGKVDDLYQFADRLKKTVEHYEGWLRTPRALVNPKTKPPCRYGEGGFQVLWADLSSNTIPSHGTSLPLRAG
ncbi:MAG: restriction endonuclease [Leptolyngbya sp. SIOISBB]|nr:restriction endonuclease [Leptolyngbya sp. SIOISBB]